MKPINMMSKTGTSKWRNRLPPSVLYAGLSVPVKGPQILAGGSSYSAVALLTNPDVIFNEQLGSCDDS